MNATIKAALMYDGRTQQVITVYRLYINGSTYATYMTEAEAKFASQYVR